MLDSFQTLLSPNAPAQYKDYGKRKKWDGTGSGYGGGGGGGSGDGPPGGGPRVTGMGKYRGTSNTSCTLPFLLRFCAHAHGHGVTQAKSYTTLRL